MKLHLTIFTSAALPLLVASQDNTTAPPLITTPDVNVTTTDVDDADASASVSPRPTPVPGCTSSTDCGEGQFCSTSSSQCETITCKAWSAGARLGESTYSETPCTEEGAEAGTAFCGWDGNCYPYNCLNWYTYGPVEFTSYDPANPVELTCTEYTNGFEDNMNSVTFGCRPWQPGNKAPEAISWTHFFNQECVANPRGSDEFKCYQNMPNTDYRDFQSGVARLNPDSCDREIYGDLIEQPIYWYIGQARQERKGVVTNYKQGRDNTLNSPSFNANLAEKTFFAVVVSEDDAPQQTFPETTTYTPEEDTSAASPNMMMMLSGLTAFSMAFVGLFSL